MSPAAAHQKGGGDGDNQDSDDVLHVDKNPLSVGGLAELPDVKVPAEKFGLATDANP